MDTSWWWALGAVVVVALIAALADGWARHGRPHPHPHVRARGVRGPLAQPTRPVQRVRPERAEGAEGAEGPVRREPPRLPRPGEIWYADVPYEEGLGAEERTCLVLALRGNVALVAQVIGGAPREPREAVIPLPEGCVAGAAGRAGYLETDELREVPLVEFRRHLGAVDQEVWAQVRHLAR